MLRKRTRFPCESEDWMNETLKLLLVIEFGCRLEERIGLMKALSAREQRRTKQVCLIGRPALAR